MEDLPFLKPILVMAANIFFSTFGATRVAAVEVNRSSDSKATAGSLYFHVPVMLDSDTVLVPIRFVRTDEMVLAVELLETADDATLFNTLVKLCAFTA
jgi:hypothetical protein